MSVRVQRDENLIKKWAVLASAIFMILRASGRIQVRLLESLSAFVFRVQGVIVARGELL